MKRAQKELVSRLLARRKLLHFIKRRDASYLDGWVHADVCRRLEKFSDDVEKRLSPRLMLLLPPRTGKSRIASVEFPAWHLGRFPDHEFIAASYNVALSMGFSRKAQAVMEDPRYPFDVELDPNNKSAETWGIEGYAGGFIAAGVGGGITGKGAHVLSIDDPIKNHEEADSLLVRESLWDWYGSTAYTRLAPGGGVLVIQTCWHDDDLAGRLQQVMLENLREEFPDPDIDMFEIVKYPAIAEADEWMDPVTDEIIRVETKEVPEREQIIDEKARLWWRNDAQLRAAHAKTDVSKLTLLRAKGEPLHPARYDLPKLLKIKKTLSTRFWSALYQQNPVPDDGSFFTRDMFKRAKLPDKGRCNVVIAWDFAIKEKQHNDWTVGTVTLQDDMDVLHFADVVRFKSNDAFFIVESIIGLIKKWRTPNLRLGFEDGQIFSALEALLKRRMREEKLYVPYVLLTPVTEKKARAAPLQGRMQQSRVSFCDKSEWFAVMQAEMLRFPNGVHDDIVDSAAWNARLADTNQPPRGIVTKEKKSWKDKIPRTDRKGGTHMSA